MSTVLKFVGNLPLFFKIYDSIYVGPIFAPTLEIDYVSHPNMINLKWAHPRFCKNLSSLIWLGVDPTCVLPNGIQISKAGQTTPDETRQPFGLLEQKSFLYRETEVKSLRQIPLYFFAFLFLTAIRLLFDRDDYDTSPEIVCRRIRQDPGPHVRLVGGTDELMK